MHDRHRRPRHQDPPTLPMSWEDRLPPQNLEAERGALGSMILDNEAIPDVFEVMAESDLYRDSHQILYRAIRALWDSGKPCDAITLVEEMTLAGAYEAFGGDDSLAGILDAVPHAANAVYYAQIVRQKAIARDLIRGAGEILREGYSNQHTAEELLALAERAVFEVADSRGEAGGAVPIIRGVADAMSRVMRRQDGEIEGLLTGWIELDSLVDGLKAGKLYVVAARPSIGKSAFALNICEYVASEPGGSRPSLLVSLEMDRVELGERLLACRSAVPLPKMRAPGGLRPSDLEAMGRAYDSLAQVPFLIEDTQGLTMSRIEAAARRAVLRQGVAAVVIDYIQLIGTDDLDADNREQEVAQISKRLKGMARRLQVPVIVLAQLNRQVENRADHKPRLTDLRESGAIEQDADAVLLLHRPDYYDPSDQPGVAEVIVAKNRGGATGTARLLWQPHLMRFVAHAPAYHPTGPALAAADEPF
jgi:replicative DNA helicase